MGRYCLIFFFTLLQWGAVAQFMPAEGRLLHYRIIGFSFPKNPGAASYTLEVAMGTNGDLEDSFLSHKIISITSSSNHIEAEVPDFGAAYTWRVITKLKGNVRRISEWHHFSTGMIKNIDTSLFRLGIRLPASKYKDAFVFVDRNSVLYDMKGKAVWYLPSLTDVPIDNITCRDLKLTPAGTITFLNGSAAYEISYDGAILWKAPDRGEVAMGGTENYHHEFTRLPNGHYMILGNERVMCKMPTDPMKMPEITGDNFQQEPGAIYDKQVMATIIEYDQDRKVVWSWKTSDYYKKAKLHLSLRKINPDFFDLHENSFFYSTATHRVYLGLKNASQVWRISYPAGVVERVYGRTEADNAEHLFCVHHACRLSGKGYVYLFNNNACKPGEPGVVMMREPASAGQQLQKVWEYYLPQQKLEANDAVKAPGAGGNVQELRDNDMFVSMCDPYGNLFITSYAKQLLWSAVMENRNAASGSWLPASQYRASVVPDRKSISKMIWYNRKH